MKKKLIIALTLIIVLTVLVSLSNRLYLLLEWGEKNTESEFDTITKDSIDVIWNDYVAWNEIEFDGDIKFSPTMWIFCGTKSKLRVELNSSDTLIIYDPGIYVKYDTLGWDGEKVKKN